MWYKVTPPPTKKEFFFATNACTHHHQVRLVQISLLRMTEPCFLSPQYHWWGVKVDTPAQTDSSPKPQTSDRRHPITQTLWSEWWMSNPRTFRWQENVMSCFSAPLLHTFFIAWLLLQMSRAVKYCKLDRLTNIGWLNKQNKCDHYHVTEWSLSSTVF